MAVRDGLPSGTVTFLFTDIEGSTRLLHDLGDAYDVVLADHRALLRECFATHNGREVGTEGDSFFVAFASAGDAVAAAVAGQRAILTHSWPGGSTLRVRMGIHTGEARIVSDDYVGLAVHQAARISSSAHGGQIVVSHTTRDLAAPGLPDGVTLVDLGEHTLKDFPQPARLFQVAHADLPSEFPRLRSLDVRRHNLPTQLTNFIGREREVEQVRELLEGNRLVTLTGAGGSGKTRLAIEIAADVLDRYADGVRLVDLAPVADADLVPQAVVNALGLREQEGRTVEGVLEDYVAMKDLLLLLDNCEHLVGSCAELVERLLKASTGLAVLVTTREALGIDGEVAWRVPSLEAPDPKGKPSVDELRSSEAVRLFIERAAGLDATFAADEEQIRAIGQICHRLDGIPLAIELAAARSEVLTPVQICARLDDRFKLLTGGKRTALARQQTLRALVDWSYGLLSEAEAALLDRVSVFVGGFTLEAAEVCTGDPVDAGDVLDLLSQLVRKSLISVEKRSDEVRYVVLETIKQYGREKLLASPGAIEVRNAHRDFFLALTEEASGFLSGADQLVWLDRLEREHDNIRAALEWCLADGDIDAALRIVGALWRFWWARGYWSEGRAWASQVLDSEQGSVGLRAKGMFVIGFLACFMADYDIAATYLHRSVEAAREAGDEHLAGYALFTLGYVTRAKNETRYARELLDQSLEIGEAFADDQLIAWSLFISSGARKPDEDEQGNFMEERNRAALEVARRSGDRWCIAMALGNLAGIEVNRGDLAAARGLAEESVAAFRELKDFYGLSSKLTTLGVIELRSGNEEQGYALFEEALELAREAGDRNMMAMLLPDLGSRAARRGDRATAKSYFDEAIAAGRSSGMPRVLGYALNAVAWFGHLDGNDAEVLPIAEEAVECFRTSEDDAGMAASMHTCGEIRRSLGDVPGAVERLKEALAISGRDEMMRPTRAACLEAIAGAFIAMDRPESGARLFGAADAIRESIDTKSEDEAGMQRDLELLRVALGADELTRQWDAGKIAVEETIQAVLNDNTPGP